MRDTACHEDTIHLEQALRVSVALQADPSGFVGKASPTQDLAAAGVARHPASPQGPSQASKSVRHFIAATTPSETCSPRLAAHSQLPVTLTHTCPLRVSSSHSRRYIGACPIAGGATAGQVFGRWAGAIAAAAADAALSLHSSSCICSAAPEQRLCSHGQHGAASPASEGIPAACLPKAPARVQDRQQECLQMLDGALAERDGPGHTVLHVCKAGQASGRAGHAPQVGW